MFKKVIENRLAVQEEENQTDYCTLKLYFQ